MTQYVRPGAEFFFAKMTHSRWGTVTTRFHFVNPDLISIRSEFAVAFAVSWCFSIDVLLVDGSIFFSSSVRFWLGHHLLTNEFSLEYSNWEACVYSRKTYLNKLSLAYKSYFETFDCTYGYTKIYENYNSIRLALYLQINSSLPLINGTEFV